MRLRFSPSPPRALDSCTCCRFFGGTCISKKSWDHPIQSSHIFLVFFIACIFFLLQYLILSRGIYIERKKFITYNCLKFYFSNYIWLLILVVILIGNINSCTLDARGFARKKPLVPTSQGKIRAVWASSSFGGLVHHPAVSWWSWARISKIKIKNRMVWD